MHGRKEDQDRLVVLLVALGITMPAAGLLVPPVLAQPMAVTPEDIPLPLLGAADDWLGESVAIEGDTIVAGAPGNDDDGRDAGAAFVYVRHATDTWALEGRLVPDDGAARDEFGTSVAIHGDTAMVGAHEDDDQGGGSGSVYVFGRIGTTWHQKAKLLADDGVSGNKFGSVVSLDGDTALIGAAGSAYVFTRTAETWSQQAKLTANDTFPSDQFARSLALDGDTALIGAESHSTNSGAVYVFTRTGTTWSQEDKLRGRDTGGADRFGHSVAIDDETALIGAHLNGDQGSASGSAYIFTRSGTEWTEQAKLLQSDGDSNDQFGAAVALDGETAVIGANGDEALATSSGSAYLFTGSGATWTERAKLIPSDGGAYERFGRPVALDGDRMAFGVKYHDHQVADDGIVYVIERDGDTWTETTELVRGDGFVADAHGWSVAVDGDTAVAGVIGDDQEGRQSGSAYVFARSGTSWHQQAKLTASDGTLGGLFGLSVAVHEDTAVVGAARGGDLRNAPVSAYVFTRTGTAWTEEAQLVTPDTASTALAAVSVAVDGDTVLVGVRSSDAAGTAAGAAYVFTRSGTTWSQEARLTADDGSKADNFGFSVALDGDDALVGAVGDDLNGPFSGSAYVFTRSGSDWTQQAKLAATDGASGALAGFSVALDGGTALVGAPSAAGLSDDPGSVYVFVRAGSTWTHQATLAADAGGPGDRFGLSVALDGDNAIAGAPDRDDLGAESGSAYLFTRSGTTWEQQAKLISHDGNAGDRFGSAVALAGASIVIGAEGADHQGAGSGATYGFRIGGLSTPAHDSTTEDVERASPGAKRNPPGDVPHGRPPHEHAHAVPV